MLAVGSHWVGLCGNGVERVWVYPLQVRARGEKTEPRRVGGLPKASPAGRRESLHLYPLVVFVYFF